MEMNGITANKEDDTVLNESSSYREFLIQQFTFERLHELLVNHKSVLALYDECQFFFEMVLLVSLFTSNITSQTSALA